MPEYEDRGECIYRSVDGVFIPKDPRNMDYQQYLEWLKAQP